MSIQMDPQELDLEDELGPENQDEGRPLTQDEIINIVMGEIEDAHGTDGTEIAAQREKAIDYYYGREFGNEIEGRSKVVMSDVQETIEWVMPQVIRMFLGGRLVVRYKPRAPEDQDAAEQATDYINMIFLEEQDGFVKFYEWFKTALLEKNAIVKVYSEDRVEPQLERYQGLTAVGLASIADDSGLEIAGHREYQSVSGVDPETGEEVREPLFDIEARRTGIQTEIKVDGVPPEEFLIARRASSLDADTPFSAQHKKVTASDLIAMGIGKDVVYGLSSDDAPRYSQGRYARHSEDGTGEELLSDRTDPASREYWVTDCYIRIDEDGDGYSELRRILISGRTILEDQEVSDTPFCSLCPILMPYKFYGMSLADLVMDLQLIRSTLLRNMLDNIYLQNNTRVEAVEGMVEMSDLLTSRPGNVVRVQAPGQVNPLVTPPLGPMAFNMLEYLEGERENRTGVTRYNQGLDANSLNQTATGISAIMNAAQARVELIARLFAATGLKQFFKKQLRLMVESPVKARVVRLRGEWVEIDPSAWSADMDVEVEVGLGFGQAAERIGRLTQLLEIQKGLMEAGMGGHLVTDQNAYNAASRLAEAMGFTVEGVFFSDPAGKPPPEPEPDPKLLEMQRKSEEDKAIHERESLRITSDKWEGEQLAAFRQQELEAKMALEREKIESAERIAMEKIHTEHERNMLSEMRSERTSDAG